jgi:hypothetical protein
MESESARNETWFVQAPLKAFQQISRYAIALNLMR